MRNKQPTACQLDTQWPLECWMGSTPLIQRKSILDLSFVGSHDCFSYGVDVSLRAPPYSAVPRVLGSFVKRWSITQRLSLYDQCKAGVRYFDFRVIYSRGTFYTVHGFCSVRFVDALGEIVRFLREHPSEIVVVDVNHLFATPRDRLAELLGLVWAQWSDVLVLNDADKLAYPLRNLVALRQQLFLFFVGVDDERPSFVWDREHIVSLWPNKNTVGKLLKTLPSLLDQVQDVSSKLTIIQAVVTPSPASIAMSLWRPSYPTNTLKIAQHANPSVHRWLCAQSPHPRINVLLIDNVQKDDPIIDELYRRVVDSL